MKKSPTVQLVAEYFVKPQSPPKESEQPLYLSPWDLMSLSTHYIQKGLLFTKPPQPPTDFIDTLVENLKTSLSVLLSHFYPLAGRLKTVVHGRDPPSIVVYVECRDSPGSRFIHAALDMTVSDLLSQTDVPPVVNSLFDHHKAVNHDGHTTSLLSVQLTELIDGVFVGTSMNHCLADGTSYWNFLKSWSEIFTRTDNSSSITQPPILKRWCPDGHGPIFSLPFRRTEDFIGRFEAPELRVRIFRFSTESIARLKAKANAESGDSATISSFQSLSALVWRSVTRARKNRDPNRTTSCLLIANIRPRLNPQLPGNYFGNSLYMLQATATAGELLDRGLGWGAEKVHRTVAEFDEKAVREYLDEWIRSPVVYRTGGLDRDSILMGSSPRFDMYGSEFGMGKPAAVLGGYANKFDGKISSFPGRSGGGSVDLEVCLPPETMAALESDSSFMEVAGLATAC